MGTLKSTLPLNRCMKNSEYCMDDLSSPLPLPLVIASSPCLCLERLREGHPGLPDVPRSERYDDVSGLHDAREIARQLRRLRHVRDVLVSVCLYPVVERLAGCARYLLFASGVDFRQYELLSVVEGRQHLVEVALCPRVPVRLEDRDHPVRPTLLRGPQYSLYLLRVVAVVVDNDYAARLSPYVKTPLDAGEAFEPGLYPLEGYLQFHRDRNGRERVIYVVLSREVERHLAEALLIVPDLEGGLHAVVDYLPGVEVGLGREAVGPEPPRYPGYEPLNDRVVEADDGAAVERDLVHEVQERGLYVVHVLVVVHVLTVYVSDDRYRGRELQKAAVALVRLGHEEVPSAELGVGPQAVELSAGDYRGVHVGRGEYHRYHRCGSRLSVGACNGYPVLHPHELGEHLSPRDDGYLAGCRLLYLRVILLNGRGVDDAVGAYDVILLVVREYGDAEALEPPRGLALRKVRARYPVGHVYEHLGYAVHE